jgi:hypothetical protein
MIRNLIASRLSAFAGIAMSVAGLGALDVNAQGRVTLSGGSGSSCSISVDAADNLNVSCSVGDPTLSQCTISGGGAVTVGGTVSLSASCTNSPTSFAWTGVTSSSGSTATFTATTAGSFPVTVRATNAVGQGVAASHTVTATAPVQVTDVPRNCSISTSPATPVAGQPATITMSCTNSPSAFAWYQYEGPAAGMATQTTSASQSVTFPSQGTYKWYLQAGNTMGNGDVFLGSVSVSAAGGNCPTVSGLVGPWSGSSLFSLRFDLKPGQTGAQEFTLPLDGFNAARITGAPSTSADTPKSTIAEVWISDCPGVKPAGLPAGCQMELWGSGQANFYVGPHIYSTCEATGRKYVNIKHRICEPSGFNGITHCSNYLKVSGQ